MTQEQVNAVQSMIYAIDGTLQGVNMSDVQYDKDGTPVGAIDNLYAFDAVELMDALIEAKFVFGNSVK